MALIDDLKVRFPDLSETCIDKFYPALASGNAEFWKCWFCFDYVAGDCNAEAILNLVAHLIVVESSGTDGSVKGVASQSVGSVSQTFVQQTGGFDGEFKSFFGSTKYGQRFLFLMSGRGGACFV